MEAYFWFFRRQPDQWSAIGLEGANAATDSSYNRWNLLQITDTIIFNRWILELRHAALEIGLQATPEK